MKKFEFRLQSLITVRGFAENRAQEAFLVAHRRHLAALDLLSKARESVGEALSHAQAERLKSVPAGECVALLNNVCRREEVLLEAGKACEEAARLEEVARGEWVDARRELKVVERLRENAKADHQRDLLRSEQETLDELAVSRARAGDPTNPMGLS